MILHILENEPLSKHTSFAIGGPARWLMRIKNREHLCEAIDFLRVHSVQYYALGQGTNTLATTRGFSGAVFKMEDRSFSLEGEYVIAAPGAMLSLVAKTATDAGLSGLEWAYGIPGTLGGAVRGNAGAFGSSIANVLVSAEVANPSSGSISVMRQDDFQYRYRGSVLAEKRALISLVTLKLSRSTPERCQALLLEFHEKKKLSQPLGTRCAGSTFKNIPQENVPVHLIPEELAGKQMVYAGWLLDRVGLKGTSRGNACFSERHANFIVNQGNATYDDVVGLISLAKEKVYNRFGIVLEEEIRYLGDDRLTY